MSKNKKIERYVDYICPHCGHENKIIITSNYPTYFVITCCVEDGGCDQPVGFGLNWQPQLQVFDMTEVAK
jgi:hypothetical protein